MTNWTSTMKRKFVLGFLSCSNFAIWTVKMDQSFGEFYFELFHKETQSLLLTRSEIVYPSPGAHHLEPATTPYSCHGVVADRSIFSLDLSWIQIPKGTSVTNCNHKHGLMSTCSHEAAMFYSHRSVLTWTGTMAYFAGKTSKNRLVCKNAVALAYNGVAGS